MNADAPQDKYLARASDALLKAAQPRRSSAGETVGGAAQTMVTVSQAASPNDTAARLALLMQMMQLVDAITRRADAERDLAKAREELARAAVPLRAEHSILEAMHKRETLPQSWSVVNGDPVRKVLRDLDAAERGARRPRAPLPEERGPSPRIDPAAPRTARSDREKTSDRDIGPER